MYIYKKLVLITHNSSWWKQKKFRRESAINLAYHRRIGWRFIKKEFIKNNEGSPDTRTFCVFYLKKKAENIPSPHHYNDMI